MSPDLRRWNSRGRFWVFHDLSGFVYTVPLDAGLTLEGVVKMLEFGLAKIRSIVPIMTRFQKTYFKPSCISRMSVRVLRILPKFVSVRVVLGRAQLG